MYIIDTFDQILKLAREGFSIEAFREYANSIFPGFAEKIESDIGDYDFDTQIMPVIASALKDEKKLEQAHKSFLLACEEMKKKLPGMPFAGVDVTVVLYLGLCNGAGWATEVNGQKTILIGIEKICELSWQDEKHMASLIYHELGHIWHDNLKQVKAPNGDTWRLCREGIATYVQHLLMGGSYYHQDRNGWLEWCRQNLSRLAREYSRRVHAYKSTDDFFGDWNKLWEHSDTGYFLAGEFVRRLVDKYSLLEVAAMEPRRIEAEFEKYVDML